MELNLEEKTVIGKLVLPKSVVDRDPRAWKKFYKDLPTVDQWQKNGNLLFAAVLNQGQVVTTLGNGDDQINLLANIYDGQTLLYNAFQPNQLRNMGYKDSLISKLTQTLIADKENPLTYTYAVLDHRHMVTATSRLFVTQADGHNAVYHSDELNRQEDGYTNQSKARLSALLPEMTVFDENKHYLDLNNPVSRHQLFVITQRLRQDPKNAWLPSDSDIKQITQGLPDYSGVLVISDSDSGKSSDEKVLEALRKLVSDRRKFVTQPNADILTAVKSNDQREN